MKDFEDLGVHCGVDEAGRGAWSGPVVAAAVRFEKRTKIVGLADSKALSPQMRIKLYFEILETFSIGVYFSSAKVIDKVNIQIALYWQCKKLSRKFLRRKIRYF